MDKFLTLMETWDGYTPVARQFSEAAVGRAMELLTNAKRMPSHRHQYLLREAITTSDFPDLFGFIIERDILARYRAVVADWRTYCAVGTMPNFNIGEEHKVQGQDERLDRVAEKGEYLVTPMHDAHYHRRVYKYGRQFDISWEALVNDALRAMRNIPQKFADACIRTEAFQVTSLYAAAAGPNPLLFGAPIVDVDTGAVTNLGALPLTIANLETTLSLMAMQVDINGEPIAVRGVHLVVPPLLEFTARQILTSAMKMWVDPAGAANAVASTFAPMPMTNVLPQMGIQLHIDPYLPVVDVSGNRNGTWYVFGDPAQGAAMQMDFLSGYEEPEICMKASDKVAVTGAPLSPFSGDFATDNVFYRVRHVLGGTQLDPRFAYAQVSA